MKLDFAIHEANRKARAQGVPFYVVHDPSELDSQGSIDKCFFVASAEDEATFYAGCECCHVAEPPAPAVPEWDKYKQDKTLPGFDNTWNTDGLPLFAGRKED